MRVSPTCLVQEGFSPDSSVIAAAISIGINDYKGTGNDLSKCVADARGWKDIFSGQLLLDLKATRTEIMAGIGSVVSTPKAREWGVICYSGHGTFGADDDGDEPDEQDEFLVPSDLDLIRDDEHRAALKVRTKGNYILAVTDSCFSGTVMRGVLPGIRYLPPAQLRRSAPLRQRATKQRALTNVCHIAACSDWEFAYEGDHYGVLTGALLDTYDKKLTIGAWFKQAKKIVLESGYPQTPQINASAAMLRHKLSEIVA